jgi:hypothetical protein
MQPPSTLSSYLHLSKQVFSDTNNLAGEKRIYAMHFDGVHERLITGSSVVDAWPLTRSVQNAIQIPSTHAQPLAAVSIPPVSRNGSANLIMIGHIRVDVSS